MLPETLKNALLCIFRWQQKCLTKLVSLLGGGFCLRFGDPDKQNDRRLKCYCSELSLQKVKSKVGNTNRSYILSM